MSESFPEFKINKGLVGSIVLLIIVVVFLFKSAVTINAGESGVLFKTFGGGVETDAPALGEGFHIIAPWNSVFVYKVRQQSISAEMGVLSVNGLEVKVDGTIWFRPDVTKLGNLHQEKGQNYISDILKPAIEASARSVFGRYTPEQLYSSKRDIIQQEILEEVSKKVKSEYIVVNEVLVNDVTLPTKIKEAIESKLKQEQESLEYEFKLQKAQKEAQKVKIEAEGKADANRILSASLTDKILREKGIEATLELAKSNNSKVVVVGNKDGMPLILGDNR
ncbi:MAG: peptidase [Flavobacteriales bacterium]|nr:peptidase [Flavobacteriales bacterium]|tara:strand:- start:140 stop:973 length:834 start_codon:yes stop_codon:yes gene_type:complete